jgi:hypothetical protein
MKQTWERLGMSKKFLSNSLKVRYVGVVIVMMILTTKILRKDGVDSSG